MHSDVGGSYKERDLSNITLTWMLSNAEKHGLKLKEGWRDGLAGDPAGEIHESYTGFWKLWPPVTRQIPDGGKIHTSVIARSQALADYNPPLPSHYIEVE